MTDKSDGNGEMKLGFGPGIPCEIYLGVQGIMFPMRYRTHVHRISEREFGFGFGDENGVPNMSLLKPVEASSFEEAIGKHVVSLRGAGAFILHDADGKSDGDNTTPNQED